MIITQRHSFISFGGIWSAPLCLQNSNGHIFFDIGKWVTEDIFSMPSVHAMPDQFQGACFPLPVGERNSYSACNSCVPPNPWLSSLTSDPSRCFRVARVLSDIIRAWLLIRNMVSSCCCISPDTPVLGLSRCLVTVSVSSNSFDKSYGYVCERIQLSDW